MKKRRISKLAVSLMLTFSMLLSLALSVYAADMTGEHIECIGISPDQRYLLEIRSIVTIHDDESMTYNRVNFLAVCDTQTGKVIRSVKSVPNYEPTFDGISTDAETFGCGVHWSEDSRFCAVDMPHDPEHGASVLLFDTKRMTSFGLVHSSELYRWIYEHDTALDLPKPDTITSTTPFIVEKWSGSTVRLLCEFDLGDGRRMWARHTQDMAQMRVLNTEWGDALDFDDPKNPIWSRAKAIGTHNYNTPMHFQSPDYSYRIEVLNAHLRSNPQTWNFLYERIVVHSGFYVYAYDLDTFHAALTEEMPYEDRPYWSSLCLKFSPDSRYMVAESMDAGVYPFYIDLETKAAAVLPPVWENKDAFAAGEMTASVEAFSAFGDAAVILVGQDGSRQRVIFDMASGKIDESSTLTGDASDEALSCTAFPWPGNLRDAFSGFTAVSKTHTYGLDGLFRVGEEYWYLHMGQDSVGTDMTPARDYVSRIQAIDHFFDRYRVLYSREGCWVLDENDRAVYAGTGNIRSCGAFVLATNLRANNPVDAVVTGKRLFDRDFNLVMDHILDTAAQPDGSVYAKYQVGLGWFTYSCLAYVDADGTVTRIGMYDGDLSEFRS